MEYIKRLSFILLMFQIEILIVFGQTNPNFDPSKPHYVETYAFPNGNFVRNWNFEKDALNWDPYWNASISRSIEVPAKYNQYSLKVVNDNTQYSMNGAHFNYYNGTYTSPSDPEFFQINGKKIVFSAWVRTGPGQGTKTIAIGIEQNGYRLYSVGEQWTKIFYTPAYFPVITTIESGVIDGNVNYQTKDSVYTGPDLNGNADSISLKSGAGMRFRGNMRLTGLNVRATIGAVDTSVFDDRFIIVPVKAAVNAGQADRLRCFINLANSQTGTFFIDGVSMEINESGDVYNTFRTSEPRISKAYSDGLMRNIQSQALIGDSMIAGTVVYDKLGRAVVSPLPVKLIGTMSYISDMISNPFIPGNSIGGQIGTYYGASETHPYSQTVYKPNPLNEVNKAYGPGVDWRTKFITTVNTIETVGSDKFFVNKVTDENGIESKTYKDGYGNTVRVIADNGGANQTVTLYQYDNVNRLMKVVPPKANQDVNSPLNTTFTYNNAGWVLSKTTPDEGLVENRYDELGNLIYSQDSKNRENLAGYQSCNHHYVQSTVGNYNETISPVNGTNLAWSVSFGEDPREGGYSEGEVYSYFTIKNSAGQIIVQRNHTQGNGSGSFTANGNTYSIHYAVEDPSYPVTGNVNYSCGSPIYHFKVSYYDKLGRLILAGEEHNNAGVSFQNLAVPAPFAVGVYPTTSNYGTGPDEWKVKYYYDTDYLNSGKNYCKGQLTKIETNTDSDNDAEIIELFGYDEYGNVYSKKITVDGLSAKIVKSYYNASGELLKMAYQENIGADDYYEWYEYDQLGQMVKAFSNTVNKKPALADVDNKYFDAAGRNLRTVLGGKAQGVDYRFNIRGWLKSINHQNLNPSQDPGQDGLVGGPNANIASDKFGMIFGYGNETGSGIENGAPATYNGSIRWAMWQTYGVQTGGTSLVGYAYQYDRLNRLTSSVFKTYVSSAWANYSGYGESLTYDANGNILSINRTLQGGSSETGLNNYVYYTNTNRLQNTDGSGSDYTYDGNGNTLTDVVSNITMTYNFLNMPVTFTKNSITTTYQYHKGNRVKKQTDGSPARYYIWGIAEYSGTTIVSFNTAFGKALVNNGVVQKYYFITDFVGSVRVVVDKNGNVVSSNDYYPFGVILPGRNSNVAGIEERFNGKKIDDESGCLYYGARYYHSKTGRWLVTDPKDQFHSPYTFSGNNSLMMRDKDGEFAEYIIMGALIGAYTGASVQSKTAACWNWKDGSWKGAITGAFIGAAAGATFASAIGASGITTSVSTSVGTTTQVATKSWGITTSIIGSANVDMAIGKLSGTKWNDLWKHGLVGAASGGFNVTLAPKIAQGNLARKLLSQGLSTAGHSIGNNWASGKDPFSHVTWGVGPVNFNIGTKGKFLSAQDNWGNIITHGLGFSNALLGGGNVNFDRSNLSFHFTGGKLGSLWGQWTQATGAYSVISNEGLSDNVYNSEISHIWQSRSFGDRFMFNFMYQGLNASLFKNSFDQFSERINFYEYLAHPIY